MKRFLTLSLGIAIAALSLQTASLGAAPANDAIGPVKTLVDNAGATTRLSCHWIFWNGRWICIS